MSRKPSNSHSEDTLEDGEIQFFDNYIPTLGVGNYVINFTQKIHPLDSDINDEFKASQSFSVQGPRYALAPEDILSYGPANNTEGLFDQYLPQIVLTKPDLPWERDIFNDHNFDDTTQTPWVALLLFVENEEINGELALQPPAVDNWQKNRQMSATISATDFFNHEEGTGILWPALAPEWYESDDYLASTEAAIIDISPEAFNRFVPRKEDLPYLSHAREIDPSSKDTSYLKMQGNGWYSVIIGKRLPNLPEESYDPELPVLPGRLNIVHLVSLEGFEHYLDGTETLPETTTSVRMISLANFSFTCLREPGDSFADLTNGLLVDENGKKSTTFNLSANIPDSGENTAENYTVDSLKKGFIPMQYQTQQGDQTFAWYRGPFSPVPVTNFIENPANPQESIQFNTSSAATLYNSEYGLFNLSYSTAWETGKFMALSDACFGPQLIAWQQSGNALLNSMLERQFQLTAFTGKKPDSKTLLNYIKKRTLTKDFIEKLTLNYSDMFKSSSYPTQKSSSTITLPPFKTLKSPIANKERLDELLKENELEAFVLKSAEDSSDYLSEWLANLYLLEGVPFENLVPNPDLLPVESIRFFYIDSNWLDCLIEGALSIGLQTSRDVYYQTLTKSQLRQSTYKAAKQARAKLIRKYTRKKPALTSDSVDKSALSGLLLRSTLVSSWPGLEIKGYAQTLPDSSEPDTDTLIGLLRMDRLSDDLMLCLWDGVPKSVTITQPQEGLQFGFSDAAVEPPQSLLSTEEEPSDYWLYLRSLGEDYGMPLPDSYTIDAMKENLIDSDRQLIINGTNGLIAALQNTLPDNPAVYVRDFVTEMIKVPEQGVFGVPPETIEGENV